MIYRDYFKCYFNDDPSHMVRKSIFDIWGIHFDMSNIERRPVKTFKEELVIASELMYDELRKHISYVNVLFSGGTDSECLVRCFHELKIPVKPIIIRHTKAPDYEETAIAFDVCNELNITPVVFDLDLDELYNNNTSIGVVERYQTCAQSMVELLYVMEQLSEPIIVGDEVTLAKRTNNANIMRIDEYKFSEWAFYLKEDLDGTFERFEHITGIPVICNSFKFTPQCWASMLKTDEIVDIVVNDRYKTSSLSTKNLMMSREFGVRLRDKKLIFQDGPYVNLSLNLLTDASVLLYEHMDLYLEYNKLLNILESGV